MHFFIVNCFANKKYDGNPLLVVQADNDLSATEQQLIAKEINFSETAFILSGKQANGGYNVRIWTPNVGEVPFAGHPTLGTAYIIHQLIEKDRENKVNLNLKVGQIPVTFADDQMMMKQNKPNFGKQYQKEEIATAFGISPDEIRDDYPIQWVSTGLPAVIVPLKNREALARLKQDKVKFKAYVKHHPENNCNHLFFVERADGDFDARCLMEDFVEDPATGSANGDLAGYFLKHNYFATNGHSYKVYQGEDMGRTSVLKVHVSTSGDDYEIQVGGQCSLIASGEWSGGVQ